MTRAHGDETLWSAADVRIDDPPTADRAWAVGCGWPVAFDVPTEPSWEPGLYLVHFDDEPGELANPAWFVLGGSEPERPLLILATNTWNA